MTVKAIPILIGNREAGRQVLISHFKHCTSAETSSLLSDQISSFKTPVGLLWTLELLFTMYRTVASINYEQFSARKAHTQHSIDPA